MTCSLEWRKGIEYAEAMKLLTRSTREGSPTLRWLTWLICLLVTTGLLVGPNLAHFLKSRIGAGNPDLDFPIFLLAKVFHVAAYALNVALTARLPTARRVRWLLVALLSVHAFGTEFVQQFVDTRTGRLEDVGLDHLGIMLGLALSWTWWRAPTEYSAEPDQT